MKTNSDRRFYIWYILAITTNCSFGAFFSGFEIGNLNLLQRFFQYVLYPYDMSDIHIGFYGSFVPIGAIFGCILAKKLAELIGRKNSLIITDFISIIGVGLTIIPIFHILLIGRLICGLATGLNCILVPLYLKEIFPIEFDRFIGPMNQGFTSLGILVSYIVGYGIPFTNNYDPNLQYDQNYWKIIMLIPGIVSFVRMIFTLVFFNFDTPKSLIYRNQEDKARAVLAKIYTPTAISDQLIINKRNIEIDFMLGKLTLIELISIKYRYRLFIGIFLSAFQQLACISIIINYAMAIILDNPHEDPTFEDFSQARDCSVLFGIIYTIAPIIANIFTRKMGRKKVLITGSILCASCLIILSFAENQIFFGIMMSLYGLFFACTLGTISRYISEILPDLGVTVAVMMNWVFSATSVFIFPLFSWNNGCLLYFGILSFIGTLLIILCVKETLGKSPAEIIEMYNNGSRENLAVRLLKIVDVEM